MAPERVQPIPTSVTHSLAELESLESAITNGSFPVVTRVSIDILGNRVKVGANNVSQTEAELNQQFGGSTPVSVYYEPQEIGYPTEPVCTHDLGREHAHGQIRDGDALSSPYLWPQACTTGYGAWENGPTMPNGTVTHRLFLLDVAHCFVTGEKAERGNADEPKERNTVGITVRDGYQYLNNNHDVNGWTTDASVVRVDLPELAPRRVIGGLGQPEDVKAVVPVPPRGKQVCFSGHVSAKVICGKITVSEKVTFRFPQGYLGTQKLWLTCFMGRSIGGDSGAPVWVRGTHNAVGLLSAGNTTESCLTPLLPIAGLPRAPGALAAPGMGALRLVTVE